MSYNCYDDEDNVDRYKNYGWKSGSSNVKPQNAIGSADKITDTAYYPNRDYNNPWDGVKEGAWVVTKSNGCTKTIKVDNPALAEVEVALAMLYDGIMKAVQQKMEDSNHFISPHDYVMAGIEHIRKEINNAKTIP